MARPRRILILFMIYLFGFINGVNGNAKLIDPPGRSSMWRYGFDVPVNKQDGYLNCGGIVTLQNNQGRCGICGDNFSSTKENEFGGKYGKGIIGKNYTQGETVPFKVQFVLGRPGHFQFRLCKLEPSMKDATRECFNRSLLASADGATKLKISTSPRNKNVTFNLVLPPDLNCERCVLQWTYTTSVVYGCDKQNNCCFGCGIQEEYVNCADIRINPSQAAITAAAMATTYAPVESTTVASNGGIGQAAPVSSNIQDLLDTQKSQLATLAKLKAQMAKLKDFHTEAMTTPPPTLSVKSTQPPAMTEPQKASTPMPAAGGGPPKNFQTFVQAFLSVTKKLQGDPQSPAALMEMLKNVKLFGPTTTPSPVADAENFLTNVLLQNKAPGPTQPTGPTFPTFVPQPNPRPPVQLPPVGYPGQPPVGMQPQPAMGVPGMGIPGMPQTGMGYPTQPQFPPQYPGTNPYGGGNTFPGGMGQMPSFPGGFQGQGMPANEASTSAASDLLGFDIPPGMSSAGLQSMLSMMGNSFGGGQNGFPDMGNTNTLAGNPMGNFMEQFSKMMSQPVPQSAPKPTNPPAQPDPKPQPQVQPPPPPAPQAVAPNPTSNLVSIASIPDLTIDTISDSQRTDILEKLKLANVVMSKQVPPVGFNEKLEAYRLVIDSALKKYNDERDQQLLLQNAQYQITNLPDNNTTPNPQLFSQQQQISELRQELQRLKNLTVNNTPAPQQTPQSNPYTVPANQRSSRFPSNGPPMSEVQLLDSLFGSGSTGGYPGASPLSPAPYAGPPGSAHPLHSRPVDFNNVDPFTLMNMGGMTGMGGMGGFGGMAGLGGMGAMSPFGFGAEALYKCDFVGIGEIEWPCIRFCQADGTSMTCVPKRQFPQYRKRCATDCAIL